MATFFPIQLKEKLSEYWRYVSGTVVDDLTGTALSVIIKWIPNDLEVRSPAPYFIATYPNGTYKVKLQSYDAALTLTPTVPGYTVVQSSTVTTSVTGGDSTVNLRVLKLPTTAPLLAISGNLNSSYVREGEWTNSAQITIQPFFDSGGYTLSSNVPPDHIGEDQGVTAGRGTHLRYLYGGTDWLSTDVSASGLPYTAASGILKLDMHDYFLADTNSDTDNMLAGSMRTTEILPSGSRYFNTLIEVSGINGSAFGPMLTYQIKFDSGDPGTATVLRSTPRSDSAELQIQSVLDDQTGYDVSYRILDSTSGYTSGWASGVVFNEYSLTENTTYSINVQARDAAGNIGDQSSATSIITLVGAPTDADLTVSLLPVSNDRPDRINLLGRATAFTNPSTGSSGYRFQVWNDTSANLDSTADNDSGWITSNRFQIDVPVDPTKQYKWGLTYRNQDAVATATLTKIVGPTYPVATDYQDTEELTETGKVIVSRDVSPVYRWGIRLSKVNLERTEYKEEGIFISREYESTEPIYQMKLSATEMIPTSFPNDDWIEYSIKFAGLSPVRIIPLNRPNYNTLVINSFMNERERLSAAKKGWIFIDNPSHLYKFNVMVNLKRPNNQPGVSPVVKDYTVHITPRATLYSLPLERGRSPSP